MLAKPLISNHPRGRFVDKAVRLLFLSTAILAASFIFLIAGIVLVLINDVTAIKDLEIMKRDFFANASHELKSPLTSILGSAELITSGIASGEDQIRDLAARMKQEADRMNRLVLDMLALSKYEDVTLAKGENDVDLILLVEDVKDQLTPLADQRKIQIETKLKSTVLKGDYEHFYELLHNLAENSIKYGVEGGHVKIAIDSAPMP